MAERHPGIPILAAVVTCGMIAATLMPVTIGALGPFLLETFGGSRSQLGLLPTAHFVVAAVFSPLLGRVVDGVGALRALVFLFLLAAGVVTGVAWAPGFGTLAAVVGIAGLGQAIANPTTNALIAEHVPEGARGTVIGIKQSGVQMSAVVAGWVLAGAAQFVGWRVVMQYAAVIPLAGLALTVWIAPNAGRRARTHARPWSAVEAVEEQTLGWLTAYAFFMGAATSAVVTYLPLFANERLAVDASVAGTTIGAAGLVGVASRITWGFWSERFTDTARVLLILATMALVAVGVVAGAPVLGPASLWVGAVLLGASGLAWNAVAMVALVRQPGARGQGWASGVVYTGFFSAYILSPPLFGLIVDRGGTYGWAWGYVGAMVLVAVAVAGRRVARPDGRAA